MTAPAPRMLTGLVLAGGAGLRMGGADKAFLPLNGRPLVELVFARLSRQVGSMAISANGDPARFASLGAPVLPDSGEPIGPLGGILAGLAEARRSGAAGIVTAAVDTPFFPADLAERLVDASGGQRIAVAASASGLHPTFGFWPAASFDALSAAVAGGERRLGRAALDLGAVRVPFAAEGADPFFNVNTPEDLEAAARLAPQE